MISPESAADIDRRLRQGKNDILEFSGLLGRVEAQTAETNTKVDNLTTKVDGLTADVNGLKTEVNDIKTEVNGRFDQVDGRFNQLEGKFDRMEGKFDRLEQLLVPPADETEGTDVTHPAALRRLGYLETKVDLHRSLWSGYGDQLKQHKHMVEIHAERLDKHEGRFDHLDSQMTEVLGILRGTSK